MAAPLSPAGVWQALRWPTKSDAIFSAKALIATAESGASEADVLMAESVEQAKLIGGAHQIEIVSANMAGRKPEF